MKRDYEKMIKTFPDLEIYFEGRFRNNDERKKFEKLLKNIRLQRKLNLLAIQEKFK